MRLEPGFPCGEPVVLDLAVTSAQGAWDSQFVLETGAVATTDLFADDMESGAGNWSQQAKVGANPWQATTLEWAAAPSPPVAHGNFPEVPVVVRGPYEYSPPDEGADFLPQHAPQQAG